MERLSNHLKLISRNKSNFINHGDVHDKHCFQVFFEKIKEQVKLDVVFKGFLTHVTIRNIAFTGKRT